jgi:hypothetical protein
MIPKYLVRDNCRCSGGENLLITRFRNPARAALPAQPELPGRHCGGTGSNICRFARQLIDRFSPTPVNPAVWAPRRTAAGVRRSSSGEHGAPMLFVVSGRVRSVADQLRRFVYALRCFPLYACSIRIAVPDRSG